MTDASRKTGEVRIGLALAASAAASVVGFFAWDVAVDLFVYSSRSLKPYGVALFFYVMLILYLPVLFATVIVGGPAWLVMHRLQLRQLPLFVVTGALIAIGFCYLVVPPRHFYLVSPFMLAPVLAGACEGYVLQRVGYKYWFP